MLQTSSAFTTQQMQYISHLLHRFSILASYIIHHHTYDLRNDLIPVPQIPPPPELRREVYHHLLIRDEISEVKSRPRFR